MNEPKRLPYVLFSGAPIGPLAERALRLADYAPTTVITDTKLTADEHIQIIEDAGAPFILVVGYGAIIKQKVLDSVAGQAINIHPSLLPEYRGPAPVIQAVLDGATETGVTLMEIDREVDHGDILDYEIYPLQGNETPADLYPILTQKGVELFLEHIDAYLAETLPLTPQNHYDATFTRYITKEDGKLDFSKDADALEREVRAFQGWPGSWTILDGKRLIITKAHLENDELVLDEVQPEGGKRMTWQAFCAGQRVKPEVMLKTLRKA